MSWLFMKGKSVDDQRFKWLSWMRVWSFLYVLKTFRLKMSIFQNRAKPTRWIFRSGVLPVDTGWEAGIHPGMPSLTTISRGHLEFPVSHVCVFGLCEVTGAPQENYCNPGRGDELGRTNQNWNQTYNLEDRTVPLLVHWSYFILVLVQSSISLTSMCFTTILMERK